MAYYGCRQGAGSLKRLLCSSSALNFSLVEMRPFWSIIRSHLAETTRRVAQNRARGDCPGRPGHPMAVWRAATLVPPMNIDYQTSLEGGKHWSFTARRGLGLNLADIEGGANVAMLFYNPANLLERYNAPDTLKCQHTFRLTRGHCLYSDMGRIFCSIIEDTLGWHDTVGGNASKALVAQRWGLVSYQQARNDWTLNGHDAFLVEAAKYGLGRRDLAANVNLFSKVAVAEGGALKFDPNHSKPGSSVTLRFEMDTLVLLHTCPHPFNPAPVYPRRPVRLSFFQTSAMTADDICLTLREENQRGFANNRLYHLCSGGH